MTINEIFGAWTSAMKNEGVTVQTQIVYMMLVPLFLAAVLYVTLTQALTH